MTELDPTKRTFGVTATEGKWLLCCDCPSGPTDPCACRDSVTVEFNMQRGFTRPNGVWWVSPVYSLIGYQGSKKLGTNGVSYYHTPDETCDWGSTPIEQVPEVFDGGVSLGPEYVACYGVDGCTAWNSMLLRCGGTGQDKVSDPPYIHGVMDFDPIPSGSADRCYPPDLIGTSQFNAGPATRQASPMFQFGNGGSARDGTAFPFYGAGDNGDTADCSPGDQHVLCGGNEKKQTASITIGDQTYTTLSLGNGFAMRLECISPDASSGSSGVCGSFNAGGITPTLRPFPGMPQALTGGSNTAQCPRMNAAVSMNFNCNGTVSWSYDGLQSLLTTDVGNNRPYRIDMTKNFGQVPGQPIMINGTWNPNVATSSGQIPVAITTKWTGGLPDSYSTVYIDWSITQV